METFGWSEDYVRKRLIGARGWVYRNWALESKMTAFGPLYECKSKGYVAQEIEKILKKKEEKVNG